MQGDRMDEPLSVSALAAAIDAALGKEFKHKFVEGEIGGWRPYPSGHVYFTLKDAGAQVDAVMFKGNFARCKARERLGDGVKVLVYATMAFYAGRGRCQLVVLDAKIAGEGELMRRYVELKMKLEAEGLFNASRKRPLPAMPRRIAMVTSEKGAVVHDMCNTLSRRFPRVSVRVFPVPVQGSAAPPAIVAALRRIYAEAIDADGTWRAQLVIVARGGGSFEDLFCFNDEELVRTVAASPVPVISAVGHETDFTLCDFAADKRAGTPSIAAEMAVPELRVVERDLERAASAISAALRGKYNVFAQSIDAAGDRLAAALKLSLARERERLAGAGAKFSSAAALRAKCANLGQGINSAAQRLAAAAAFALAGERSRLREAAARLSLLSPFSVLERGYALATDAAGRVVKDASRAKPGDTISLRLAKGSLSAKVEKVSPPAQ